MSLSYVNMPVYIGTLDATGVSEVTGYLPATQVSVNYNTSPTPRRPLGGAVATGDQFAFPTPLSANISFSCVLQKDFEKAFEFFNAPSSYVPIKIGNNIYQKCYIDDISISIAPYVPVTFGAKFTSLEPPTEQPISGDATPYAGVVIPLDSDQLIYGHTCSVENMGNVVGDVQSQINYKKIHSRSPIYTLGSVNATSMLLDSTEEEMSITSTGLNNLINFSGDLLSSSVKVNLTSQDGQGLDALDDGVSMNAGARVITERYGVAGHETVQTTATIKQITL
jgi:hypothetical protein